MMHLLGSCFVLLLVLVGASLGAFPMLLGSVFKRSSKKSRPNLSYQQKMAIRNNFKERSGKNNVFLRSINIVSQGLTVRLVEMSTFQKR